MNRRLAHVFLFAVALASLSSFLMYRMLLASSLTSSRKPPPPPKKLLVAARDLDVGALITERDVQVISSLAELPPGAIVQASEAIGRGVISAIYKGEPVLPGRLAPRGAGAGLASMIPIGKRAVALRVNEVVGVAGFVVPGMRVDVVISGGGSEAGSSRSGTLSRTVLQNIEVLSAGQHIERSTDGKPSDAQVVNLVVTPDQAEILSLAGSETKVQLVLRNPMDTQEQSTHGTSLAQLFGGSIPPPSEILVAPPPRIERVRSEIVRPLVPVMTVEVFHGVKKSEETFASNGAAK